MTIQEFIKDPIPFNKALSIKLIQHAQRIHKSVCGEYLKVSIEGIGFYGGDVDEWFKKEWAEFVKSLESATKEELQEATDKMISGFQRAVLCDEIDKR